MNNCRIYLFISIFLSFSSHVLAEELDCPNPDYIQAPIIQTEFVNQNTAFYFKTSQIQDHTKPAVILYGTNPNISLDIYNLSSTYKKVTPKNLSHHQISDIQNNYLDATNLVPLEKKILPNDGIAGLYHYPIYNEKNVLYPALEWKIFPTLESDQKQKSSNGSILTSLTFLYETNLDPRTYLILAHIQQSNKTTSIILKPTISYPQKIQINSLKCEELNIKNDESYKVSFDILTHDGKIIEWQSRPLYFNSSGKQNLTFWQKIQNHWTIFKLKYLI